MSEVRALERKEIKRDRGKDAKKNLGFLGFIKLVPKPVYFPSSFSLRTKNRTGSEKLES